MRVIHLADYGGRYAGSFIPMLVALARTAAERGHESEVMFTSVARGRGWLTDLEDAGLRARVTESDSRHDLYTAIRERLPADDSPTLLHTHFHGFDLPAAAAARRYRTAVLWHVQSRLETGRLVQAKSMVKYGLVGRMVDRIVCVAPDIADAARRRLAPARRIVEMPNAVDVDRFGAPSPERRRAIRRSLNISDHVPLLLHFGWDWERKGGDVFLDTVRLLRADGLPVRGLSVGGGAGAVAATAEMGLADAVEVVDAVDEVGDLYAAADVFVSCSRAEGMPFSMLEALASGTAVVASDLPGQAVMAAAGCRVVALEPSALAGAIGSLLSRPPHDASAESTAARGWVSANASMAAWSQRLVDLYEEVLAAKS